MGRYFDYEEAAAQAGISRDDLEAIRRRVESDYAGDLLRELHLMRICREIGRGTSSVADAIEPGDGRPPPLSGLRMGG